MHTKTTRTNPVGAPRFDSAAGFCPHRGGAGHEYHAVWRLATSIKETGPPSPDVPHDGARHTALRVRVGNGRARPGSTPGAGIEAQNMTGDTPEESTGGELQLYADCPECGETVAAWCDCPSCGWYDAEMWADTLAYEYDPRRRPSMPDDTAAKESEKTAPNDWYAIQFERNKMGIAEFIELHDNGALEYRTPDGRHGIRADGNWEGVQQKGETGLLAMYDDDVFSPQAERIIEGRYNVVD